MGRAGKQQKHDDDDDDGSGRDAVPIHQRQRRVCEMLLSGCYSVRQMAVAFKVTQPTIIADIKAVRKEWIQQNRTFARNQVILRVRQLEHLYNLALNDFKRSQKPKKEISITIKPCDNPECTHGVIRYEDGNEECSRCQGEGVIRARSVRKVEQTGNPAYLNVARDCIQECARLEGITKGATAFSIKNRNTDFLPDGAVKEQVVGLLMTAPTDLIIEGLTQIDSVYERIRNGNIKTIDVSPDDKKIS